MKKILLFCLCAALSVAAWADDFDAQQVKYKLQHFILLEKEYGQWNVENIDPHFDTGYEEALTIAEDLFQKNPKSFVAAYNYGLLLSALNDWESGEYNHTNDLLKAFEAFEVARAQLPNKIMVLEREYSVIKRLLIGTDFPYRKKFNEDFLHIYQRESVKADILQTLVLRLFQLNNIPLDRPCEEALKDKVLQAFLACLALEKDDLAKMWLKVLGGERELKSIWFNSRNDAELMREHNNKINWGRLQEQYNAALKRIGIRVSVWEQEFMRQHLTRSLKEQMQENAPRAAAQPSSDVAKVYKF